MSKMEVQAKRHLASILVFLCLFVTGVSIGEVWADGNETLGPPTIEINSGSGTVSAGVGMGVGGTIGTISFAVPAEATVNQVLLYWYGRGTPDDTLVVNGNSVTGEKIGENNSGVTLPGGASTSFRADITSLELVSAGLNNLEVSGWDFTFDEGGAGVVVIFDDGSKSDIQIVDGHDFTADDYSPLGGTPLEFTGPQKLTFAPATDDRTATVDLFIANGDVNRPDAVEITVGGTVSQVGFEDITVPSSPGYISGSHFDSGSFSFTASNIFIIGNDPTACGGLTPCADSGTQTLVSLGQEVTIQEASGGTFSLRRLDVAEGIVDYYPATTFTITGQLDGGGMVTGTFNLDDKIDGLGADDFRTYTLPASFATAVLTSATISALDDTFSLDNIVLATPGGDFIREENVVNTIDGLRWDTLRFDGAAFPSVHIPAGETMVTAQVISFDPDPSIPSPSGPKPDSIAWVASTLAVQCTGRIGDRVWFDTDENGCQDDGEPGKSGVTVKLFTVEGACGNVSARTEIDSTITDMDGIYEFTGLCPGDYEVVFETPDGFEPTKPNSDSCHPQDEKDSDCIVDTPVCVSLDNNEDLTIDCGLVPLCQLEVEKFCSEILQPVGLECTDHIVATTLQYTGDIPLTNVSLDPDKSPTVTYENVNPGDILTLSAENDFTIDARPDEIELGSKLKILINDVETEIIHTSCSAPYIAGQPAPLDGSSPAVPGNPDPNKGDPSPNWFVVNFVDKDSPDLVNEPESPALKNECEVIAQSPNCGTNNETIDNPDTLTWRYTGGGCAASNNSQIGKTGDWLCNSTPNDFPDPAPEPVTIRDDNGIGHILNLGDEFTISRSDSKEFTLTNDSYIENIGLHTSCSQPLIAGEVFGSLTLMALDGQRGENVEYTYSIKNTGIAAVIVNVDDDQLGSIAAGLTILGGGDTVDVKEKVLLTTIGEVINTATVTDVDNPDCLATDTAKVTVTEPCNTCKGGTTELTFQYLGISAANVVVYDSGSEDPNKILFQSTVVPNGELTITPRQGQNDLNNDISFYVDDVFNAKVHTSCSKPIGPNAVFGDFEVVSGRSKDNGLMCPLVVCDPAPVETLELHDKEVRWNVTNNGELGLEIKSISISWPTANGDLVEIKRDGDTIHKMDFQAPSAIIDSSWEGDANKRTIKPGETDTLKFKFRNDVDIEPLGPYSITIEFTALNCSIEIEGNGVVN